MNSYFMQVQPPKPLTKADMKRLQKMIDKAHRDLQKSDKPLYTCY